MCDTPVLTTVQVSEKLNAFRVTYAYITRVHDYFTQIVVIVYAYETQYICMKTLNVSVRARHVRVRVCACACACTYVHTCMHVRAYVLVLMRARVCARTVRYMTRKRYT